MRAVVQRVSRAKVTVEGRVTGEIGAGAMVLLGVGQGDSSEGAKYLADKTANLRIFADAEGKMNRSLVDIGGAALVVSQFTLYGDTRGGRRPGFSRAAQPEEANRLYEEYVQALRGFGLPVETGIFQTHMDVELINDGPVTILLDSEKLFSLPVTHSAKPSQEVVIRAAREADISELTRLSAQLGYPSSEAQIRERLNRIVRSPVAAILVAESSGGVAGWMQLIAQEILETGPRVEVAALVVDEKVRGKGIGRLLMKRAEEWARERNCKTILLRSNVTRAGAHAFYERLGFEHIKTSKTFKKILA